MELVKFFDLFEESSSEDDSLYGIKVDGGIICACCGAFIEDEDAQILKSVTWNIGDYRLINLIKEVMEDE